MIPYADPLMWAETPRFFNLMNEETFSVDVFSVPVFLLYNNKFFVLTALKEG